MKQLYCIPNISQINSYLNFSKENNAGFEYNDFFLPDFLDDEKKVQDRIDFYCNLDRDRSEDTLHGAFLDLCVNSSDSLIYRVSDYRIRQSMDIAQKLGVKAVIFHTNHIPNFRLSSYREGWLLENTKYWKKLLKDYPNLSIYIENMFDEEPELLRKLAENMKDEPRFAVCLDLAHAFISSSPIEQWLEEVGPYAAHLHINDNNRFEDTHHPVGSMNFPWEKYEKYIHSLAKNARPTVLVEVRGYEDLEASVSYMKKQGLYPFSSLL